METCILACWDYLDMPDNIDTQPLFDDEDDIEDAYICPLHGECDGPECVRC